MVDLVWLAAVLLAACGDEGTSTVDSVKEAPEGSAVDTAWLPLGDTVVPAPVGIEMFAIVPGVSIFLRTVSRSCSRSWTAKIDPLQRSMGCAVRSD